jgi:hypothetical protein
MLVDDHLTQLLNGHALSLRDAQDHKQRHQQHKAAKEEEGAPLEAAQQREEQLPNEEGEAAGAGKEGRGGNSRGMR